MMHTISLALLFFMPLFIVSAFGVPGDTCFEQADGTFCDFATDPWNAMLSPIDAILGDFTIMVVWGIILGVVWLKTNNTMLVGIIGVLIASMVVGLYPQAMAIGALLFAVAIGIVLYQLIQSKIRYPA